MDDTQLKKQIDDMLLNDVHNCTRENMKDCVDNVRKTRQKLLELVTNLTANYEYDNYKGCSQCGTFSGLVTPKTTEVELANAGSNVRTEDKLNNNAKSVGEK